MAEILEYPDWSIRRYELCSTFFEYKVHITYFPRGTDQNLILEPYKYTYDMDELHLERDDTISYRYFSKKSNEPGKGGAC